jgi:hypothetical protein
MEAAIKEQTNPKGFWSIRELSTGYSRGESELVRRLRLTKALTKFTDKK